MKKHILIVSTIIFFLTTLAIGDELKKDPLEDAYLISTKQTKVDKKGKFKRIKLFEVDDDQHPLIRVEEHFEQKVNAAGVIEEKKKYQEEMIGDRIIVKLKHGKTKKDLKKIIKQFDGSIRKILPESNLHIISFDGRQIDAMDNIKALLNKAKDVIEYCEPDYIYRTNLEPNDPKYPVYYGFWNYLWGMHKINASTAWDYSTGSKDVLVGVLDTGVDYRHEDLAENLWINSGEIPDNGIDDDNNGYIDDIKGYDWWNNDNDPMDLNGHGTLISGTIGAVGNNGLGVVGVCWNVTILPLQIGSSTGAISSYYATEAIYYAINKGVKVLNASWGGGGYSQTLKDALDTANTNGLIFVAAAGNGGSDHIGDNNDEYPFYPSYYDCSNLISVAAIGMYNREGQYEEEIADFSNYGINSVDLGAPGTEIWSTFNPDLPAWKAGKYSPASGTSMAAPHVAGAVALILSLRPNLKAKPNHIKSLILNNVDKLDSLTGKVLSEGRLNIGKVALSTESFTEIMAKGSPSDGVWPQMQLWLGDQLLAEWTVDNDEYEIYSTIITPSDLEGIEYAYVVFTNDAYSGPDEDRNLFVDYIKINDRIMHSEYPGVVYDRGVFNDGIDTIPGQEEMLWTGGLRFAFNKEYITIRAKGDPAIDIWPIMQLYLDDQFITEWDVNTDQYQNYTAEVDYTSLNNTEYICVNYPNDYYVGGEDRNLYVDYIQMGDYFIRSDGPGVIYDVGPDFLDDINTFAGQENMVWQGALRFYRDRNFIQINAKGTFADGEWPLMKEQSYASTEWTVDTIDYYPYIANYNPIENVRSLSLWFGNYFNDGNEERTLFVDSIALGDNGIFQTEGRRVKITAHPGEYNQFFPGVEKMWTNNSTISFICRPEDEIGDLDYPQIGRLKPYSDLEIGATITSGDVDNDGTDEIITGTESGAGIVRVFDIKGNLINEFTACSDTQEGINVYADDIIFNDDTEIITAPIGTDVAPLVKVFLSDGSLFLQFLAYEENCGVTIAAGDIDGDGVKEIITGTGSGEAHIKIFNNHGGLKCDGFIVYDYEGGVNIAVGDIDSDGVDEIITGPAQSNADPIVKIFTASGEEILNFNAYPDCQCDVIIAVGDINGDGIAEIITGSKDAFSARVKIFDRSGELKDKINTQFYSTHIALGDVNGDGIKEVIRGQSQYYIVNVFNYLKTEALNWGPKCMNDLITVCGDYDGDDITDVTLYNPSKADWYIRESKRAGYSNSPRFYGYTWGQADAVPVSGDYDGDGIIDMGVFYIKEDNNAGTWDIKLSSTGENGGLKSWGHPGVIPAPGNYDRDGLNDFAILDPVSNKWYIWETDEQGAPNYYGYIWPSSTPSGIKKMTVPGDYDGDGLTDLALFVNEVNNSHWYIKESSTGIEQYYNFPSNEMIPEVIPVPGDYDGDRKTDIALYHFNKGEWDILFSSTELWLKGYRYGPERGAIPAISYHDNDIKSDLAVYASINGAWYIQNSTEVNLEALSRVAKYNAADQIEAENCDDQHDGVTIIAGAEGYIGNLDTNEWVRYACVDFGDSGYNKFTANIACADEYAGKQIYIRLESKDGDIISTLNVEGTGGWNTYMEQSTYFDSTITGIYHVYLTFDGGNGVGNIDWFKFGNYSLTNIELENMVINQNKHYECIGYISAKSFAIKDGAYVVFKADADGIGDDYIKLDTGFKVELGSTFKAIIGN